MVSSSSILFISILILVFSISHAYDPNPLQDFCVGVNESKAAVFVNGRACKNPRFVTVEDFVYSGDLNEAREVTSPIGSRITPIFEPIFHALNTMGISISRVDFVPNGLNPPHEHPRSSEIFLVTKGKLYAGFITSNSLTPNVPNKLYAKTLNAGDLMVFPKGLIHFQYNVGDGDAVAYASFSSQNPGVVTVARSLFASEPAINPEVLAKAFQLDEDKIEELQSMEWPGNL